MEKVEEAKQSVIIPNNVERTFYEITIEDIKKRIERLETRNEQLIEIQEQVKNDSTSTDVNTTNEIAQLNRDLSVELNKIANAQKAIDLLNNQRHEEQNRHDSKVNFIKQMHDNTRKELLCQIKISNAKINALEDFHNNEECIREKMRKNDDFLVEKEEKLKAKFNQLDIAFKIFRAKLMDDLKIKIFKLSESLASDNLKKIPHSINKLFHENAAIRDELDLMKIYISNKKNSSLITKSQEISILNSKQDIVNHLSALKSQKRLIEKFLENSETVIPISDKILSDYDAQVVKLQTGETDSEEKLAQLKYSLCFKTFQLTEAQKLHNKVCSNIKKYSDTLYDMKYAVACALEIENTAPEISSLKVTQFIKHLYNLSK
ncbi:Protein of unknown function [Cotesia congregata]|uniref:Uncharacterized protein n=1 Tax=Cotesia congregata TaxID=51543 RepID=A0A8J2MS51_COTCN|nr:Protein of unknown function [Cotesia congregata]